MPSFPLSARLVAAPLWAGLALREWIVERGRPLLEIHVGGRNELPLAHQIAAVAESEDVRGLLFRVDGIHAGWATLSAVRQALLRIRKAGKFVAFELEQCANAELYLASAADRVWIRPMVQVHLLGVGASLRFAGDALERFGLRFDIEAAGAYKSFGETFTRGFASAENREAMTALVTELQEELETAIAAGRRLEVADVRRAVLDAPLDPHEAVARKLIDGAAYPDQVHDELESLLGEDFAVRPFAGWYRGHAARVRVEQWIEGRKRVAVVHLVGNVVDGDGAPGVEAIAARPVSKALDELAEDDGVVAAVLDIRSPGGSATASDVIWRSVERLQKKKPVVAVFGDVAASGGYYIAAPAQEILAQANTLTGSIGVVGGKLVVGGALARVGVHTERVLGSPLATYFSSDVPFDDVQRVRFRAGLERFYRGFVERVAAGRKKPYDTVEPFARGRVWTGRRAKAVGLVDDIGGVEEGIERAAKLAGVGPIRRMDVRTSHGPSRVVRIARSLMLLAMPQLRLVPEIPDAARALAESKGAAMFLFPWDVEIS